MCRRPVTRTCSAAGLFRIALPCHHGCELPAPSSVAHNPRRLWQFDAQGAALHHNPR